MGERPPGPATAPVCSQLPHRPWVRIQRATPLGLLLFEQKVTDMYCLRLRRYLLCFASLVLLTPGPRAAAQASTTASRGAGISVFGGLQFANPEYGPSHTNTGGAVGLDFTRFIHFPVQPSLDIRANFNSGPYADERSYLFGLRGVLGVGRLQPYVDFLVGPGDIHFPKNVGYVGDNSIVYNYGGGVDLGVTRHFSLRLDIQAQHWNTGELRFNPTLGTVGIAYQIPFRPRVSQDTLIR